MSTRLFLFASGASGAVFAIGNKNNSVSVGIGDFVLVGIEFVKLGAVKFCGNSFFEHKKHLLII